MGDPNSYGAKAMRRLRKCRSGEHDECLPKDCPGAEKLAAEDDEKRLYLAILIVCKEQGLNPKELWRHLGLSCPDNAFYIAIEKIDKDYQGKPSFHDMLRARILVKQALSQLGQVYAEERPADPEPEPVETTPKVPAKPKPKEPEHTGNRW